ncbi:hypothetical protein [Glycomyces arizonensis]|uniref:hypothetical protein n=1 Tax=Glycomyces arizonensis TaxID=256035 RepID=UPI0012EB13E7|nr:hypothetical protein [Glycomyces arizonensis]
MLLADPSPGPVGLCSGEPVHADAEQAARDRTAVEVGVESRDRDALEVDVEQGLVKREIGELRELAGIP